MKFRMKLAAATGAVVMAVSGTGQAASGPGACGAEYAKVNAKAYSLVFKSNAKFCQKGGTEAVAIDIGSKVDPKLQKLAESYNKKVLKALPECDADFAELFATMLGPVSPGTFVAQLGATDYLDACDGTDDPGIP